MTSATKKTMRELTLSIVAPLFVSICIGVFVWYTNAIASAEQDKARDNKITAVETNQAAMGSKIDKIADDVAFIRGQLSGR